MKRKDVLAIADKAVPKKFRGQGRILPATDIVVGQGCSFGVGNDSYPCTVIDASPSGKTLKTRDAAVKVVSGSGHDGSAVYEFSENPEGAEREWSLRSDGRFWQVGGKHTLLSTNGYAKRYDPHF